MHGFTCLAQPEIERQATEDIKAASRPGNEDVLCFAEFVKEGNFHRFSYSTFILYAANTSSVKQANTIRSISSMSFSAARVSLTAIRAAAGIGEPKTPQLMAGKAMVFTPVARANSKHAW